LSEAVPAYASKKTMPLKELANWAEANIMWNDEVYTHNDLGVTKGRGKSKTVSVCNLNKSTWFQRHQGGASDAEYLNITSCTDCVVYVTTPPRFCHVSGCTDCTIIMVAVSSMCTIQNSEKVTVHVATPCFKMENCTDSSAYVYCRIPPILTGDTRGIKLAPFNVMYSETTNTLAAAGLSFDAEFSDTWANPVCCTLGSPDETIGSAKDHGDSNSTYHFVHPKNFRPVVVPEEAKASSQSSPSRLLCLPEVYEEAYKSRIQEVQALHKQMDSISDDTKRKRAQMAIQGHFREWLQSTGKSRQLADLARMAQMAATQAL